MSHPVHRRTVPGKQESYSDQVFLVHPTLGNGLSVNSMLECGVVIAVTNTSGTLMRHVILRVTRTALCSVFNSVALALDGTDGTITTCNHLTAYRNH